MNECPAFNLKEKRGFALSFPYSVEGGMKVEEESAFFFEKLSH